MGRHDVDYNKLDKDVLMEMELEDELDTFTFIRIKKRKKFDDGTSSTKTGRKKHTVQRGGKDIIEEEKDEE